MPLRVLNMSLPVSGLDIRLAEAREVLRNRPETKLLVFGVVERLERDGHQAFADLGTTGDILTSPLLVNRNLPESVLRLPMRQMKLFAGTQFPQAFGYRRTFDPAFYPGASPQRSQLVGWQPAVPEHPLDSAAHAAAIAAESRRRTREITPPILPDSLARIEFGVSRSSIESLLTLAERNGVKVVFLYLPYYDGWDEPGDAEWLRSQAPLWIINSHMRDPSNYLDAAHVSEKAQPGLSRELAGQIVELLAAESPNSPSTGGSS
jgi:hypothetical protein